VIAPVAEEQNKSLNQLHHL